MASYLEAVRNNLTSFLWGDTPKIQLPPKTPEEVFKENISEIAAMSCSDQEYEKECIDKCIEVIVNDFEGLEFILSESNRKMITLHENTFEKAVDETPYILPDDAQKIKSQFKYAYSLFLEKQWGMAAAKSFYPIPSIRDQDEQTAAAQNWTEQFFAGVSFFNKFKDFAPIIVGDFVAKVVNKTSTALHSYCHEKMQQNMAVMQKRAEHDPISFSKMMDEVTAKAEKNPDVLSDQEREYFEFAENLACCLTQHWPNVDKKIDLMKKCVWHGFTLQQHHWSIVGTDISQSLFASAFAEKK